MAQNAQVKVVRNATIIDGTGKRPVKDASIIIKGNVIEEVGKTLDAPRGAEVIDAAGKTVMPGLIDAHVHVCSNGDPNVMAIMGFQPGLVQLYGAYNAARRHSTQATRRYATWVHRTATPSPSRRR